MELGELPRSTVSELNQRCVVHMFRLYAPSSRTMEVCRAHSLTLLPRPSDRLRYMEEFRMNILLATVALATLVSSSADAQCRNWRAYYGAYARVPPYSAYRSYGFNRAYAQVPPYAAYYGAYARAPYFATPGFYDLYGRPAPYPNSVYSVRGVYIGSDPDPLVRDQLARD